MVKIAKIKSICLQKNSIKIIDIETDISRGLFYYSISGNIDKSISESKQLILAALKNSNFDLPSRKNYKVTTSLLPNNFPKTNYGTELGIVLSYLLATGQIHIPKAESYLCIGNISVDGGIYFETTKLVHAISYAHSLGYSHFVIPKLQGEANNTLVNYINTFNNISYIQAEKISNLKDININQTSTTKNTPYTTLEISTAVEGQTEQNINKRYLFDTITGLKYQKRALIIAAAGNHPLLYAGVPGTGKSTLASACIELLDNISLSEIDANTPTKHTENIFKRNSMVIGPETSIIKTMGRQDDLENSPRQGTIIINELCEFSKKEIESLRIFLENNNIYNDQIHKGKIHSTLIIATTNNCPCGRNSKENNKNTQTEITWQKQDNSCVCTKNRIEQYQNRLSESVLDRFPLVCNFVYERNHSTDDVENQKAQINKTPQETALFIHKKIAAARIIQRKRSHKYNQELTVAEIYTLGITEQGQTELKKITDLFAFSKRKILHTLRVARTIADIEQKTHIEKTHILEAISHVKVRAFN